MLPNHEGGKHNKIMETTTTSNGRFCITSDKLPRIEGKHLDSEKGTAVATVANLPSVDLALRAMSILSTWRTIELTLTQAGGK